nr:hypothetical protein [Arthrospira sp. PLM2.Bin9]
MEPAPTIINYPVGRVDWGGLTGAGLVILLVGNLIDSGTRPYNYQLSGGAG